MLVHANLAAMEPERFIQQDFVGLSSLRNDPVCDANLNPFRIRAAWQPEHVLGFVDLSIGVLGEQNRSGRGCAGKSNERVTHRKTPWSDVPSAVERNGKPQCG